MGVCQADNTKRSCDEEGCRMPAKKCSPMKHFQQWVKFAKQTSHVTLVTMSSSGVQCISFSWGLPRLTPADTLRNFCNGQYTEGVLSTATESAWGFLYWVLLHCWDTFVMVAGFKFNNIFQVWELKDEETKKMFVHHIYSELLWTFCNTWYAGIA